MKVDFAKFTGSLPYASELYGIYQPLLGWKSRLMTRRIDAGLASFRRQFLAGMFGRFLPDASIDGQQLHPKEVQFRVGFAQERGDRYPLMSVAPNSHLAARVLSEVVRSGPDRPETWARATSADYLTQALKDVQPDIRTEYEADLTRSSRAVVSEAAQRKILSAILDRESIVAGALKTLGSSGNGTDARGVLMANMTASRLKNITMSFAGLWKVIDPRESELASAVISPVGIVHLFRQYFFEFDTFLGPAVEHLWLSPGGKVELVEISTRKTIVERLVETAFEQIQKTESSSATTDELSDAVRSQNSSSTKFGVSLNTSNSFSLASVFTSQLNAGSTYDLSTNQESAREQIHRGTRQQTQWISSELNRSVKTMFKVTTETTDTQSRKYVIENTTSELVNYELRRKMRQVGIQVQDYGTSLCWQTYVDDPGNELGLANLVHIAVPNDMPPRQQPELPPDPVPYNGDVLKMHFRWPLDEPSSDILFASPDIPSEYYSDVVAGGFSVNPSPGFRIERVDVKVVAGENWAFQGRPAAGSDRPVAPGSAEQTATRIEVFHPPNVQDGPTWRQPITDEHPEFDFEVTPVFVPSNWLMEQVAAAKEEKIKAANQAQEREYKEKLFTAVKERVKLASNVQPRPAEDLREEERIVVYRNLIRQLMSDTGVAEAAPKVRHIFAELIQSMFDVDKMLYFVAPEWWVPKSLHPTEQGVFRPEVDQAEFRRYSTVSWSGARGQRDDNYYITEDSAPAKLGSSLAWIIQLDGDNLRNAFLNAPWVKAVIPIREGAERRAIDWLSASNVEGQDGLGAAYEAAPDELQRIRAAIGLEAGAVVTIRNAVDALIVRIQEKQAASREKATSAAGDSLDFLPTDKVYEHGFDPLAGGFKAQGGEPFEVFDQWVEVVPTDQIVPVPVEYDPKTGMQV